VPRTGGPEATSIQVETVGRPPLERWFVQWRALGFDEVIVKGANGRYRPGLATEDWAVVPIPAR
jgi:hypothetical protein